MLTYEKNIIPRFYLHALSRKKTSFPKWLANYFRGTSSSSFPLPGDHARDGRHERGGGRGERGDGTTIPPERPSFAVRKREDEGEARRRRKGSQELAEVVKAEDRAVLERRHSSVKQQWMASKGFTFTDTVQIRASSGTDFIKRWLIRYYKRQKRQGIQVGLPTFLLAITASYITFLF